MKPLPTRVADYTSAKPIEVTTAQVYDRILWMLGEERRLLEEDILAPRVPARKREMFCVQRDRLVTDITIVEAMKARHLGLPVQVGEKRIPPTAPGPATGYAEP